MNDQTLTPLIGVPADLRQIDGMAFHAVGDKYVRAVLTASHGLPLVLPAFGELYDVPARVHVGGAAGQQAVRRRQAESRAWCVSQGFQGIQII